MLPLAYQEKMYSTIIENHSALTQLLRNFLHDWYLLTAAEHVLQPLRDVLSVWPPSLISGHNRPREIREW